MAQLLRSTIVGIKLLQNSDRRQRVPTKKHIVKRSLLLLNHFAEKVNTVVNHQETIAS